MFLTHKHSLSMHLHHNVIIIFQTHLLILSNGWIQCIQTWGTLTLKWFNTGLLPCLFLKGNRLDIVCCVKLPEGEAVKKDSFLFLFFKKIYAPFILKDWVRPFVVSNLQPHWVLHVDANIFGSTFQCCHMTRSFRLRPGGRVCGNAVLQYCCNG